MSLDIVGYAKKYESGRKKLPKQRRKRMYIPSREQCDKSTKYPKCTLKKIKRHEG